MYIGVNDKGYVVGTDTSNAARSRIQDTINKIEPRLNVSIDVLENIVVLTVPEGIYKPYSCPAGFFLRSGPNSQKLDRDSIIEFCQNEGRVRYDQIVREDLPVVERFNEAAYRRFIKAAKISDVLDREIILTNLKCAAMSGGKLCFTNAGALFFRTNDEDVEYRHAGIVCALYKGTDKAYVLDAKELNGDIVSNVNDAIIFLKKHLRISFKIEGLRRENILELPEDALREAVINAACHRNYFEQGARIMVEIFDDRVDIVSPGGVCKGITPENFGTVSITRNSLVVNMFYRIGYIEQMGTGIMRMKEAAIDANVAEPRFELNNFFKVTFKRNEIVNLNGSQTVVNGSQAVASGSQSVASSSQAAASGHQAVVSGRKRSQAVAMTDRKQAVIEFLKEHGQAKAPELSSVVGLSDGRVRAVLREMASEGIIEKISDDRYAYYVLK